jgi:hypothetical protein
MQRCRRRHQDFQGTICGRTLLSWPLLPNALVGQNLTTSGNNIESPADISPASAALCRRAPPWTIGLHQNSFCSARMQNHRTPETRKAANYRCQNVYILTTTRQRIVDTLELFPHNYQMSQLSSTDRLLMASKDMTDAFQNPHPEVPFAIVGDDTVKALANSNYSRLCPLRPTLRLSQSSHAQA